MQAQHTISRPGGGAPLAFFTLRPDVLRVGPPGAPYLTLEIHDEPDDDLVEGLLGLAADFCAEHDIEPAYWIVRVDGRVPEERMVSRGLRRLYEDVCSSYDPAAVPPVSDEIARRFVPVSRDSAADLERYLRVHVATFSDTADPFLAAEARALGGVLDALPGTDAEALVQLGLEYNAIGDDTVEHLYVVDGAPVATLVVSQFFGTLCTAGCLPAFRPMRADGLIALHLERFGIHWLAARGIREVGTRCHADNRASLAVTRRLGGVETSRAVAYGGLRSDGQELVLTPAA